MRLYEPLGTLKPFGEDIWIVDGPIVRMSYFGGSVPFPTRMVVIRLGGGELFVWSPIEPGEGLCSQINSLGRVRHLVSPNKIHYAHIAAWKRIYPEAVAWASPGVRERAAGRNIEVAFDAELGDTAETEWSEDLDHLVFRGSRYMEEVVFFHRKSKTVILADLIENFEAERLGVPLRWATRLAGAAHPDGKAPLDLRMTFIGGKREARASLRHMLEWNPEKVVMAHGRPYERDGAAELRRAFRWV